MSNQLSENNVPVLRKTTTWTNITSNKLIKNCLMLSLFVAILFLFNYSLHARLAPQELRSLYAGTFVNEFDRPITFESDGWIVTEGDWSVSEGTLTHINFYTPNPALIIPISAKPEDTVYLSADIQIGSNRDSGGLRFNMESPEQIIHSHRVAILRQGEQTILTGGYYEENLDFNSQFQIYLDSLFEEDTQTNLLIQANSETYSVYLNGDLMAENVPTIYPPAWQGFSAIGDSTLFNRIEVGISSEERSENLTELLTYAQTFEKVIGTDEPSYINQESAKGGTLIQSTNGDLVETEWVSKEGVWTARSNTLIQSDGDQADSYAIYQFPHNVYRLDIDVRHLQNQALGGGGILFGLEEPNSLKNGFLARFTDDGTGFFYGRYDEDEKLKGLGFQPVLPVRNNTQNLTLTNDGTQFSLTLNDVVVFEGLEHPGIEGYFGLISNEAEVVFEQVLFSSEATHGDNSTADSTLADEIAEQLSEADLMVVSGEWLTDGENIIQIDSEPIDHIGGLDRFEKQFNIEASITITSNSSLVNSGGGFIFNMPQQDSKNGGQIVRFLNGGSEVIWGYFNESGQFIGQSGVALGSPQNTVQQLSVRISESTFAIWVNEELIAADLPLQETEGWVGLMTFGGPIEFEDLDIQSTVQE